MRRLIMIAASMTLSGCGGPPSESEMRNCAEAYIQLLEIYRVENGELPERLEDLESAYRSRFQEVVAEFSFPVDYKRRTQFDSERKTTFVLIVGNITSDRRELSYDSADDEWYFDS